MLPKSWDLLRKSLGGLYPASAAKSDAAITTLQHFLGDDFVEEAWKNKHPFVYRWAFNSSWIPDQLEWMVERISAFGDNPYSKTLRHELRLQDRADERLHVLEQAYRFRKAGLQVVFDRKFEIDGRNRSPDLTLTSPNGDICVVEITAMQESRAIIDGDAMFARVTGAIHHRGPLLPYGGVLYRVPTEEEVETITSAIVLFSEKADLKGELGLLQIRGLIDFIVGGRGQEQVVAAWLKAKGIEPHSFGGPPVGQHEPSRLAGKIRDKVAQLPEGTFNVLVIMTSPLSGQTRTQEDEMELIETLTAELESQPKISLLVIDSSHPFRYEVRENDPAFHFQTYEPFYFRRLILTGTSQVTLTTETRAMVARGLR